MVQLSKLHIFENLFQCFSKYGPWAPELAFWDAYGNSQSYWVSLSTRTFNKFYARMAGGSWSRVAGLFPCLTCPSPRPLLSRHCSYMVPISQINCSPISIPLALYAAPQTTALFYRCLLWICWIMFHSSFPLSDYTISPFPHWEMCNWPCFPLPKALESNSQLKYHNWKGRHWLCIRVLFPPWTLPVLIYVLLAAEY